MKVLMSRIAVVLVFVFGVTFGYSQTTATVTGVVTDSLGAVMPGVSVVLSNPTTGVSYTVKTNSAGSYRVPNVPPGPGYSIEFTFEGFSPYQVKNFYVNVATPANRMRGSRPAPRSRASYATGAQGVTLNTTDASIGNNFQVSKLQDLPV